MSKNKMQIKYKEPKRKRNKNVNVSSDNEIKKNVISAVCIVAFILLVYLGLLGLEKLGLFEKGYTKPSNDVTISETNILIGEVFNRNNDEYLVLFDKLDNNGSSYIRSLLSSREDKVYYVDMNDGFNKKYASDEANKDAKNASELKINDVTLIRIKNGKIDMYKTGEEEIEEYLK